MYAGMDFAPAESVDDEVFGLDFVNDLSRLSPGEQLSSVVAMRIGVASGEDDDPEAHLDGSAIVSINPFNDTGLTTMVTQRLSGLLAGVSYWLEASALTTNGNTISLWARIPAGDPPQTWLGI